VVDSTVKVTTPEALETPEAAEITGMPLPEIFPSVTVLPLTGLLCASSKVTVKVEVEVPSAVNEVGNALSVDLLDDTAPAVKVTLAVCVMVTESELSVAVKTSVAAVADFTVKVTTPEALEVPEAAEMVGLPEPEVLARVTVLPETGLPPASFRVTVMVEVVLPSATTEAGEALTVDSAAVTNTGEKVTLAVWVIVTESELSVAVKTSVAVVVLVTVKVTTPAALDEPEAAEITGLPTPEVCARVTVLPLTGLPLTSCKVTVMVEAMLPSATTDAGEALRVDWAAVTGPINVTLAVWVTMMESELSVAVKTSVAAVVDFTVKVTTPEALEVPDAAEIVGLPEPEVFASVTVLPETGLPCASARVTVMVEVVVPSAATEPGEAFTVD